MDQFVDPENYGKFFFFSKEVEESMKLYSEAQLNFIADSLAYDLNMMMTKYIIEMKNNQM
jgi:hypothetical protein